MTAHDPFRDVIAEMSGALADIAEIVGLPRGCHDYPQIVRRVARLGFDADSPNLARNPVVGDGRCDSTSPRVAPPTQAGGA